MFIFTRTTMTGVNSMFWYLFSDCSYWLFYSKLLFYLFIVFCAVTGTEDCPTDYILIPGGTYRDPITKNKISASKFCGNSLPEIKSKFKFGWISKDSQINFSVYSWGELLLISNFCLSWAMRSYSYCPQQGRFISSLWMFIHKIYCHQPFEI